MIYNQHKQSHLIATREIICFSYIWAIHKKYCSKIWVRYINKQNLPNEGCGKPDNIYTTWSLSNLSLANVVSQYWQIAILTH